MVDVTIIGDINVDLITSPIKKYPNKNSQLTVPSIKLDPGGCGCNTAIACSRMGLKTKFIGKLTDDLFSKYLMNTLKSVGVKTKMKIIKKQNTGITLGTTFNDMKRSFITYRGTNETLSSRDFKPSDISGKILIVTGFNLLDSLRKDVKKIFDYAKKSGMITGLDPNWDPKGWTDKRLNELYNIFKSTDLFFPSLEEAGAITKTKNERLMVKKLLYLGCKTVCLKLNERGCLVGHENNIKLIRSFEVKTLSTTGSGDVFLAAFIRGHLSGWSIDDTVLFANTAGAISTTRVGLKKYPTYNEVNRFLRSRGVDIGK